jgi:hypothetical protein
MPQTQMTVELTVTVNGAPTVVEIETIDVADVMLYNNPDNLLRMLVGKLVNRAKQPIITALHDKLENLRCKDRSE